MFHQMSLKAKLLILSGTMALGLLAVGTIGSYTLTQVSKSSDHVASVNFTKFRWIASMRYSATDMAKNYLRLLIPGIEAEDVAVVKSAVESDIENFSKANKIYLEIALSEEEKSLYEAEERTWNAFREAALNFVALQGSRKPEDIARYQELVSKELPKLRTAHADTLGKLMELQTNDSETWIKKSQDAAHTGTVFSWILTIACFLAAITFGLLLSNSLAKTLQDIANRLSNGADEVASASQQVSSSSEELSAAATEQAASIQETSASVEEMSAMIQKNAENAAQSQKVSASSQITAEKGKETVSHMLRSMDEINSSNIEIMQQIEESNRNISGIVKVITEIGNKTKVINDIVFQTKLLSFNASVEAARAGEHGKGFAVVAEEVGNLAHMSGAAAKEISSMLDESIKKVEDIVKDTQTKVERLIQSGKEKINAGTETAKLCSNALDEMAQSIDEVGRMVSEITTASREQATGVSQINEAMGHLDRATQQNAAASQQTASASEQLSSQASSLRSMVMELMRTVDGGTTEARSSQAKQDRLGTITHLPLKHNAKAEGPPSGCDSRFRMG